jgi:hypothetical protein
MVWRAGIPDKSISAQFQQCRSMSWSRMPTSEFSFVNSTLEDPHIPQDVTTRVLIRKQAMKKAAASRRRRGNYGRHNLRQLPVWIEDNVTLQLVKGDILCPERCSLPADRDRHTHNGCNCIYKGSQSGFRSPIRAPLQSLKDRLLVSSNIQEFLLQKDSSC